jgi:Holliday junction DNA helicase RuvA
VRTLSSAIASGDSTYLTKVSGIGRKSAGKIVVELKDKVGGFTPSNLDEATLQGEAETLEALQALGYSLRDSREALKKASVVGSDSQDLIKAALKTLSRKS